MAIDPHSDVVSVMTEVLPIREMVRRSDYQAASLALLELHERDDRLLAQAADLLAEDPTFHPLVEARVRDVDDDILARALLAHSEIVRGWSVRGRRAAAHVAQTHFQSFHQHLRLAEQHLIEICALEPSWPYPWYLRLTTSRGLELGINETMRRYDRLAAHDPHHHPAQAQVLQQLCPKWGGTWEKASEFARNCAEAARAGSAEHAIIADLHLEQWRALDPPEAKKYLSDEVLHDLHAAAASSVRHPDHERGLNWVRLHSTFGVLFALAGERGAAESHLAHVGEVLDPRVAGYLDTKELAKVQSIRKGLKTRSGVA